MKFHNLQIEAWMLLQDDEHTFGNLICSGLVDPPEPDIGIPDPEVYLDECIFLGKDLTDGLTDAQESRLKRFIIEELETRHGERDIL